MGRHVYFQGTKRWRVPLRSESQAGTKRLRVPLRGAGGTGRHETLTRSATSNSRFKFRKSDHSSGEMRFLLILLGLVAVGAKGADESPFIPVNSPTTAMRAADGTTFELRGIMSTTGGTMYCIYDPVKKSSTWVGLNEKGGSFVVRGTDGAHDTVTLDAGGQMMTLGLRQAKVASLPGGASALPPGGAMSNVVLKPTPEDEQRRLQAIAEEVRRRRELRERAQSR